METSIEQPVGGFTFDLTARNARLASSETGYKVPKATKTGTTICGVIFKHGVVLGADTRATNDTIVAQKNCQKIHYIAPNIYCCGAGTAADTEQSTKMIASQLELHRLTTGRKSRVVTACRLLKQMLFKYQGNIGAALVLGGVDINGPTLYSIHPHGSTDKLPYVTMGSGSLAAMAVFEAGYRPDMEEADAVKLVRDAIAAGIFNDLGSGSNVDVCILTKDSTQMIRPFEIANVKPPQEQSYRPPRGATVILTETIDKSADIEQLQTDRDVMQL
ncbi:proteasome subunit beta 7 [Capsaspora owczarzaki ATCC 30864]|nr:proteasome subunit beta 7 [Capsaspora owczarzaki ATCC 30864]|eukprot:XP_004342897.1 proteasome subunit beta 7 [Capsaspora owczarzaki ATCC 30864]